MTTTPAAKGIRIAALGLSAVLSIGALTPFVGASSASAADCTTVSHSYSTASAKLAKHHAKLVKAKKKLKKDRKHHKSHATIKHDKKMVKKFKRKVRADRSVRNHYATKVTTCSSSSTSPQTGAASPLASLLSLLTGDASGLSPAALTGALDALGSLLSASGAPGAAQLGTAFKQIADAVDANAATLDPTKFQGALTSALSQVQRELQAAAADPTGMTVQGLIDDVISPLVTGLTQAGVPSLPGVLTQLQDALDPILGQIPGLGVLLGGGTLPIPSLG